MRMNLRLIKASQFLSQFFNLKIRHKSDKYHLISNALFRLQSLNKKNLSDDHAELNDLFVEHNVIYVYNITLMKLNSEFCKRIIENYFKDDAWKRIIQIIDQNTALKENVAKLSFIRESQMISRESDLYMTSNINTSTISLNFSNAVFFCNEDQDLIYHVNKFTEEKRLCILSNCVSNILTIAHEQKHSDFEVSFEIISRSWYIKDLIKILR